MNRAEGQGFVEVGLEGELLDIFVAVEQQVVADHVPDQPRAPVDKAFAQWVPGFLAVVGEVVVAGKARVAVAKDRRQRQGVEGIVGLGIPGAGSVIDTLAAAPLQRVLSIQRQRLYAGHLGVERPQVVHLHPVPAARERAASGAKGIDLHGHGAERHLVIEVVIHVDAGHAKIAQVIIGA